MNFLVDLYNNKLLFYGIIAIILFVIVTIILLKKAKKDSEEELIDYEKIDGKNSLFDEVLESKEKNPNKPLDLDSMIEKMQKDLDAKASDVVEKFENEQEEKSVISYQELLNSTKKEENIKEITLNDDLQSDNTNFNQILNEIETSADPEENVIDEYSKLELDNLVDAIEEETAEVSPLTKLNKKEEFVSAIKTGDFDNDIVNSEPKGKFKATEFISPIYGRQDIKIQYPTVQNMKEFRQPAKNYNKFELEQTLNLEPLSDEIRRDEDFLKALKEFRKNLE